MLKILPQAHSTHRGATKPSDGPTNEERDLDALARRIRNLSNVPSASDIFGEICPCGSPVFCLLLIDSI
jgi:hypothetical protein